MRIQVAVLCELAKAALGGKKSKKVLLRKNLFAVRTGLEPVTSCVTGRHSNQAELTHQLVV